MPGNYYRKTVFPTDLAALQGKWYDEDMVDSYIIIRGNTFLYFMDGDEEDGVYAPDNDEDDFRLTAGEIVDYTSNGTSGILYIHTVIAGDDYSGYNNDKFEAFAWKDLVGNDFAITAYNGSSLADIKSARSSLNDFDTDGWYDYVKQ
jgi:hypothetical protein